MSFSQKLNDRDIDKKPDNRLALKISLVSIILISILILPLSSVDIHNNTAIYLRQADKIVENEGTGMIFPDFESTRGPLYPVILASSFKIMGKTVHSASLVTRLFFSLGIILVYLFGRILYDPSVGIISSVLVMTSYGINYIAEFIDTDIVLPFFILLFTLLYYLSLSRSNRYTALLAGFTLGLALMVKESALLCLGIPLGMPFLAPRGKHLDYTKKSLWVIVATLITLAPWMIVTLKTHGSLLPMFGVVHPEAFQNLVGRSIGSASSSSYLLHLFTFGVKDAFCFFYYDFLQRTTLMAPLMIAGWFTLLLRGLFLRRMNDLILAIPVICFIPLILYTADTHDRTGQLTVVYMLLYVCLASFIGSCIPLMGGFFCNILSRFGKTTIPSKVNHTMLLLIGCVFVGLQLFPKKESTWDKWTRGSNSLAVFTRDKFNAKGRFTNDQLEAAEWIKKNTPIGSKVMADGYSTEPLEFFDVSDKAIPLFRPKSSVSIAFGQVSVREDGDRPIYLFTYSGFRSGAARHRIFYPIFEEDIVSALESHSHGYLVISWRSLFYGTYFEKAKWVELKFANESVRVYEVDLTKFEPVTFENIGVNDTIEEHLFWLKEKHPNEYLMFEEKLKTFSITFDELKDSPLKFPPSQIY